MEGVHVSFKNAPENRVQEFKGGREEGNHLRKKE
jgi:hypothetical protein